MVCFAIEVSMPLKLLKLPTVFCYWAKAFLDEPKSELCNKWAFWDYEAKLAGLFLVPLLLACEGERDLETKDLLDEELTNFPPGIIWRAS